MCRLQKQHVLELHLFRSLLCSCSCHAYNVHGHQENAAFVKLCHCRNVTATQKTWNQTHKYQQPSFLPQYSVCNYCDGQHEIAARAQFKELFCITQTIHKLLSNDWELLILKDGKNGVSNNLCWFSAAIRWKRILFPPLPLLFFLNWFTQYFWTIHI